MEMEQLVALCKRRGFLFQSSEIYGGLNGFWDYGPLGVELKRNVREAWWRDMVTGHNELDVPAGAPSAYEMTGPRLHDHHAPAGLEVLGPLRPVPRLHGRLPRIEKPLPLRPDPAAAGSNAKGQADLCRHEAERRGEAEAETAAEGAEVLQPRAARTPTSCTGRAAGHR